MTYAIVKLLTVLRPHEPREHIPTITGSCTYLSKICGPLHNRSGNGKSDHRQKNRPTIGRKIVEKFSKNMPSKIGESWLIAKEFLARRRTFFPTIVGQLIVGQSAVGDKSQAIGSQFSDNCRTIVKNFRTNRRQFANNFFANFRFPDRLCISLTWRFVFSEIGHSPEYPNLETKACWMKNLRRETHHVAWLCVSS